MANTMMDDVDVSSEKLSGQVASFFFHAIVALLAWAALMLAGYVLNPASASQLVILILSLLVPGLWAFSWSGRSRTRWPGTSGCWG